MPELPEVEAVVRKLKRVLPKSRICGVRVLRPRATHPQDPAELRRAVGHSVQRVERRGKNIILHLDGDLALHAHLKMTGNLTVIPDHRLHASTVRVLFELSGGRGLVMDDRRLLGYVHLQTEEELSRKLADIGIDPLSRDFTPEFLMEVARRSRKPAKLFLMEQKPIAGLGNIYSAEALFRARVHPEKRMETLNPPQMLALWAGIKGGLQSALPDAIRSYREPDNFEGMTYMVYGREGQPCYVCGKKVRCIQQAGRSTYFCPGCQRKSAL